MGLCTLKQKLAGVQPDISQHASADWMWAPGPLTWCHLLHSIVSVRISHLCKERMVIYSAAHPKTALANYSTDTKHCVHQLTFHLLPVAAYNGAAHINPSGMLWSPIATTMMGAMSVKALNATAKPSGRLWSVCEGTRAADIATHWQREGCRPYCTNDTEPQSC